MEKFTVTQFIDYLNAAFSAAVFPSGVAVEGEIAEYRVSQGKWIWFLLKDETATVSCFATTWKLRQPLEDGMQVRVLGLPKIHAKSGKFSLNVERVEPVGEGALKRAYELLKQNLQQEGLFGAARKRSLPRFPERIGLIASRESAAYTDFLRILGNRWGGVEVNSVHVQVQGQEAVESIVRAFDYFNAHPELADVLVLTRGGGSMQDLHAFNSEEVARAVFGAQIPVVVGVGHERDESLADFVADVRASTPSNAAEIIVPDRNEFTVQLKATVNRLTGAMDEQVQSRVSLVGRSLHRLETSIMSSVAQFKHRWHDLQRSFEQFTERTSRLTAACTQHHQRLNVTMQNKLTGLAQQLTAQERMLASLNPRHVLRRGYAVVRSAGRALQSTQDVKVGQSVDIELHEGALTAEVKSISNK